MTTTVFTHFVVIQTVAVVAVSAVTWSCFNLSCYTVLDTYHNKSEAEQACEELGLVLAELDTSEKMDHVRQLVNGTNQEYWVGLDVIEADYGILGMILVYKWHTRQLAPLDEFWGAGEPSETDQDPCVRLTYHFGDVYTLGDESCSRNYKAICERSIHLQAPSGEFVSLLYKLLRVTEFTFVCQGQQRTTRKLECARRCTISSTCVGFEWELTQQTCTLYNSDQNCNLTDTADLYLR